MTLTKKTRWSLAALAAAATLVGCATVPGSAEMDQLADGMMKSAFRTQGIANVERVTQIDETLKLCNAADVAGKPVVI